MFYLIKLVGVFAVLGFIPYLSYRTAVRNNRLSQEEDVQHALNRGTASSDLVLPFLNKYPRSQKFRACWVKVSIIENGVEAPETQARIAEFRKLFPRDPFACRLHAKTLAAQGRGEQAEAILYAARRRGPKDLEQFYVYVDYAAIAEERQDWDAALTRWRETQKMFPLQHGPRVAAARIHLRRRDIQAAQRAARDALTISPRDEAVLRVCAETAGEAGDWVDAAKHWATFRSQFPLKADGYLLGAAALARTGDCAAAQRTLDTGRFMIPKDGRLTAKASARTEQPGEGRS